MNDHVLYTGRFLELLDRGGWECVGRPGVTGIVAVVAVTEDDEVLFVEQPRPPIGKPVIEIPAGLAGDEAGFKNQSLAETAIRELEEETGYRAAAVEELFVGPPSAGLSTEMVTFFRATGVRKVSDDVGVGGESITRHVVPRRRVTRFLKDAIAAGRVVDPKVFTGLWWLDRGR